MKKSLAVILGLGFILRLVCLGRRQLWTDELLQALILRASSLADFAGRLKHGMVFPAPLDYIVQKGFVAVAGDSNWGLRLHAVVFGTLSLWFFYRIGRRMFGVRPAIYCTVLFTFFPLHYHYSQEARPYALVVLLALVSYDLLLRIVSNRGSAGWGWAMLGGVLVLLLYSSIFGFAVILSQALTLACTGFLPAGPALGKEEEIRDLRPARQSEIVAFAVVGVLAVAVLVPWEQYAWSKPMVAHPRDIANPKLVLAMIKELGDNSYPVAALLLLGVITGVRAMLRHGKRQSLFWLLMWFGIPIPVVLAFDLWSGYPLAVREVIFATPPLLLISGYGLSFVGERVTLLAELPSRLSSPAIVYAAAMIAGCMWIAQARWRNEPVDWLGTARTLEGMVREGDAVAIPGVRPFLEYYAPALEQFRTPNLDLKGRLPADAQYSRRIVVCYDGMAPNPCAGFREGAQADPAWSKLRLRGFTLFVRGK